jgi:hypothetical protein
MENVYDGKNLLQFEERSTILDLPFQEKRALKRTINNLRGKTLR